MALDGWTQLGNAVAYLLRSKTLGVCAHRQKVESEGAAGTAPCQDFPMLLGREFLGLAFVPHHFEGTFRLFVGGGDLLLYLGSGLLHFG